MTDMQCKRYAELMQMSGKRYREYDEMTELRKSMKLSDTIRINWYINGCKDMITYIYSGELKKIAGQDDLKLAKAAIDAGCAKWFETRSHHRDITGVELTQDAAKAYINHYSK